MKFKQVKSYQDVAKILNIDPNNLPDVSAYADQDKEAATAIFKLWNASRAAWGDIKIDWDNYSQRKYYGWFDLRASAGSGSGFACDDYDCAYGYSHVGARLVFPSLEDLKHAVKVFEQEYKAVFTIPK
jgi:hypothetical protein